MPLDTCAYLVRDFAEGLAEGALAGDESVVYDACCLWCLRRGEGGRGGAGEVAGQKKIGQRLNRGTITDSSGMR